MEMKRFPKGARVCFVGDSITYANTFVAHIVSYYRKHFAEDHISFYSCAIPGSALQTTLRIFDEHITPHKPTHLVLLMGMNDCSLTCLTEPREKQYDLTKSYFEAFQENLSCFCEKAKEIGAELTLCTTTPYDEYQDSDVAVYPGGYALLMGYANYIRNFAAENNYPLCDYHSYLSEKMHKEKLISNDRVHPNSRGHYYIAKCFLKFQGLDLGEEEPLPADVAHWAVVVKDFCDVLTAEHYILRDDFTKTDAERIAAVNAYSVDETLSNADFYRILKNSYSANKANQTKNLRFILDFMNKS